MLLVPSCEVRLTRQPQNLSHYHATGAEGEHLSHNPGATVPFRYSLARVTTEQAMYMQRKHTHMHKQGAGHRRTGAGELLLCSPGENARELFYYALVRSDVVLSSFYRSSISYDATLATGRQEHAEPHIRKTPGSAPSTLDTRNESYKLLRVHVDKLHQQPWVWRSWLNSAVPNPHRAAYKCNCARLWCK